MPISLKNQQTEELARRLAALTGESLTDAIRIAIIERYDRLRRARARHTVEEQLNEIGVRCARRPVISNMTDDEILGYDESGVPTK
jgi:antitoxin VapB